MPHRAHITLAAALLAALGVSALVLALEHPARAQVWQDRRLAELVDVAAICHRGVEYLATAHTLNQTVSLGVQPAVGLDGRPLPCAEVGADEAGAARRPGWRVP